MQEALHKQLSSEEERLRYDLVQKKKIFETLEAERESTGVQLYESQQKLVSLHATIENEQILARDIGIKKSSLLEHRLELEDELARVKKDNFNTELSYKRRLDELSKQNMEFLKIEEFLDNLKVEQNIKKRENLKSEEIISIEERRKDRQDYLINSLREEKKRNINARDALKVKLEAQGVNKAYLGEFLTETKTEIEKISLTQRNILINLKRSIIDLGEKSKGLDLAKEVLKHEKDKLDVTKTVLIGAKKEKASVLNVYAKYEALIQKLRSSLAIIEKEKDNLSNKKKRSLAKLDVLTIALKSTEEDVLIFNSKQTKAKMSISNIESTFMKMQAEVQKILNDIFQKSSENKTSNKLHKNIRTKILNLSLKDREIEQELENVENEMARLRLDILNTEIISAGLLNTKTAVQKESEEREKIIVKCENEIRSNNDVHDKKMLEVAKYNTEYHKIKQKISSITAAPAEAALLNAKEQLLQIKRNRKDIEGEFIHFQTLNIEREIVLSKTVSDTSELSKKENVLFQKLKRLNDEYREEEKEIKMLQSAAKSIENEMNKLNELFAQFNEKNGELRGKNANYQADFVEKLKVFEDEAARLELEVDRLKEKKAELLQEIVEVEQQGLLWERKIELEKQMQSTLNPDVGQTDIMRLRKEAHLLELDLEKIKKEQEYYATEVERAVQKREYIGYKYQQKENSHPNINTKSSKNISVSSTKTGGINTAARSSFSYNIEVLKNAINKALKQLDDIEKKTLIIKEKIYECSVEHADIMHEIENLKDSLTHEKKEALSHKLRKLTTTLEVFKHQQSSIALEQIIKKGESSKVSSSKIEIFSRLSKDFNQFYLVILETIKDDADTLFVKKHLQEYIKLQDN